MAVVLLLMGLSWAPFLAHTTLEDTLDFTSETSDLIRQTVVYGVTVP